MTFAHKNGTPDDDLIYGNKRDVIIHALAGNDYVVGGVGNDRIFGEEGNDSLSGYYGSDTIFGGDGNDVMSASDFDSGNIGKMYGGAGDDTLGGGDVVDYSYGGAGNDVVHVYFDLGGAAKGGSGQDTLWMHFIGSSVATAGVTTDAHVVLNGPNAGASAGNQTMNISGFEVLNITTYEGNDTVVGGKFGDTIDVFSGANWVEAGAGDDLVSYRTGAENHLDGGTGKDWLEVAQPYRVGGLSLQVTGKAAVDGAGSVISHFEHYRVFGGDDVDTVTLGQWHDLFRGYAGDDTVAGMGGSDRINAGDGNDTVDGGSGDDWISGGRGIDLLTGGDGADVFHFAGLDSLGDEITDMQSGSDRIILNQVLVGGLVRLGAVGGGKFHLDVASGTAGQFVYRSAGVGQGELIWDSNGTLDGGEVLIARLDGMPMLHASDLFIL
ncbi:MAG: calcium-binding protein [bacterium]